MSKLYYCAYNNYYSRICKIAGDTVDNYTQYILQQADYNHNFTVRDGVQATSVCNGYALLAHAPDYLLVTSDTSNVIMSRWFIMEAQHQSGSQYRLTLRRDVVADYYSAIMSAMTYVQKGWVPDTSDLIFNTEDLTLNQIKQGEHLIKDETGVSWAVAYIPSEGDIAKSISGSRTATVITVTKISDFDYYDVAGKTLYYAPKYTYGLRTKINNQNYNIDVNKNTYNIGLSWTSYYPFLTGTPNTVTQQLYGNWTQYYSMHKNEIDTHTQDAFNVHLDDGGYSTSVRPILTKQQYNDIRYYNNCVIKVLQDEQGNPDERYYLMKVKDKVAVVNPVITDTTSYGSIGTDLFNAYGLPETGYMGQFTKSQSIVMVPTKAITIELIEDVSYNVNLHNTGIILSDAPYRMLTIPYKDEEGNGVKYWVGNTEYTSQPDKVLPILKDLATQFGSDLYSYQLLPYCPVRSMLEGDELHIDKTGEEEYTYELIKDEDSNIVGFAAYCDVSQFSFSVPYTYSITNTKVQAQTEMLRFCSPNYNGVFEFNPAKNGGIEYLNISCTYKPVQPYIRVAPNFGRLYGSDYSDARGLICGGSFDLPQTNSAYLEWERTNSTYQDQFSREIQHMETNYEVERANQITRMFVGAVGGAVSGATAGHFIAGGFGSGIGAAMGGAMSLGAGAADLIMNDKLHKEAIDYTSDKFNMSLRNIQAIPNSLTKVGAYNSDNKIFPFIEIYDCSSVEKEAFVAKLKYDGMSIGVIGKISDYIDPDADMQYVKGQVIHIDINEDYHLISEIGSEIFKGVYIV